MLEFIIKKKYFRYDASIQERGVSILSINKDGLINTENGSAISIQSSFRKSGTVIERNDYISTKYGSQNRLNAISTDLGLYWIDNNNASINLSS